MKYALMLAFGFMLQIKNLFFFTTTFFLKFVIYRLDEFFNVFFFFNFDNFTMSQFSTAINK